jgi:hypothetical protein
MYMDMQYGQTIGHAAWTLAAAWTLTCSRDMDISIYMGMQHAKLDMDM